MGKGEINSAASAKQVMSDLNRDEVYRKMNEFHEHPFIQQQGIARLQEIDREEDDARHQETRDMHAESMAETKAMHKELKKMEKWGLRIAGLALLVSILFPALDFFGYSWKSAPNSPPPVPQAEGSSPIPSGASKNQEPEPKAASESKELQKTLLDETAKTAEEPRPAGQ